MAKVRRFYKEVSVAEREGGYVVRLDDRPVRSPRLQPMPLPNRSLAEALAAEWRQQGEDIDVAAMPLMRLSGHVIDAIVHDPEPVRAEIVRYAGSDLLCYRAAHPAVLVARQGEAWDPLLERYRIELGIGIKSGRGIVHVAQDPADIARFASLVADLHGFELAGAHAVTTLTGSALIAMALRLGWLEAPAAWQIAHIDEDFQSEQWGIDQEALQRRQALFADFGAALLALTTTGRVPDGD